MDVATGEFVGELRWGIKSGFRRYVAELPDGSITAADGAHSLIDGRYAFPILRIRSAETVVIELGGSVRFEGHGGLLSVQIAQLEVQIDGDLFAIDAAGTAEHPRITIARGAGPVYDSAGSPVSPRLAPEGVALFDGNYPVGTELDAVELLLGAAVS